VAHFEQAIAALAHLPHERAILEQAIDLHWNLRLVYLQVAEMSRVLEHLRAAEALAETLGDQRRLTSILASLTQYLSHTGDHDRALETGHCAVALAADGGSLTLQVEADHWLASVYQAMGDYAQACAYDRRLVALMPAERLYERFALGGVPSIQCRAAIVRCLAEQGAFAVAQDYIDEAIRIAEHVDHTISWLHAYHEAGYLALRHGDLVKAIPLLERGWALCQMRQAHAFNTRFRSTLGAAYTLSGRGAEALLLLEQAAAESVTTGLLAYYAHSLIHLSGAYLLTGRLEDATAVAAQVLTYCREHKERGHEAMALCTLGAIAAQHDASDVEQAAAYYQQGLALAVTLGMRPLQAHCHRGLGMLYAQLGQQEQARTALSVASDLYRAMDMTFWLPQTEAALAQVEGR
jgi:tetratricopeptide (TPR) repeat protein